MSNALVRAFQMTSAFAIEIRFTSSLALDGAETGMPAIVSPIEIVHLGYRDDVMLERKKYERNMEIAESRAACRARRSVQLVQFATSAMLADRTPDAISALERMHELALQRQRERGEQRLQSFVPNGLCLLAEPLSQRVPRRSEEPRVSHAKCWCMRRQLADAHFILGKCFVAQRRFVDAREAYVAAIEDGKEAHRQPLSTTRSSYGRPIRRSARP